MKKKKILISITTQYGYHTDTYKYCQYLDKSNYEITYIGFDTGMPQIDAPDLRIIYIPVYANKIRRYLKYISCVCSEIRNNKYDLIFQVDSQATMLIRLLNLRQPMVLDIRTGNLSISSGKRKYKNRLIWFTSLFYKNISVISSRLRDKLKLSQHKTIIIPLGADYNYFAGKKFEKIKLFYIGDLTDRRIDDTINGLGEYLKNVNPAMEITYDIVGFGTIEKIQLLNETIKRNHLESVVKFHGRKNHKEAEVFFKECNVGIIYVPITPWFDCQPTTKLYECLLSGMAVIATNTKENESEVCPEVGVLIDDNPQSFCDGLKCIIEDKHKYSSFQIASLFHNSTWINIVNKQLAPYFDKILYK